MTVNPKLKRKNKNAKHGSVIVRVLLPDKKEWKLHTGIKVPAKVWSKTTKKTKPSYQFAIEVNARIEKAVADVQKVIHEAEYREENIKQALDRVFKKNGGERSLKPLQTIQNHVADLTETKAKKETTLKTYRTLIKHLEASAIEFTDWSTAKNFQNEFSQYLLNPKPDGAGLNNNSANKYLRAFRAVINQLVEIDLIPPIHIGGLAVKAEEADEIALTIPDLQKLKAVNTNSQLEAFTKDIFLFMVSTGLRISDAQSISTRTTYTEHFTDPDTGAIIASIDNQKTGKHVPFRLMPEQQNALERWQYDLSRYSEQHLNSTLKILGQRAGLTETVIKKTTVGSETIETKHKKYERITNHTARRTYSTIMDSQGVPVDAIQETLGHYSQKETRRYIKKKTVNKMLPMLKVNVI